MTNRSKQLTIWESNELVSARYSWTVQQQRVVLMMMADLDPTAEDFGVQRVQISELIEIAGARNNALYQRSKEAALDLLDQKIAIKLPSGSYKFYNLMSSVEPRKGYILARFNPDMRPFLLQLKNNFTRFLLKNVVRFQSPYSIRIYVMTAQFRDTGFRIILVDTLREALMLEDKYSRFRDFKKRVIDQSIKEINEFSDLELSYEVSYVNNNQPHSIRFSVKEKDIPEETRKEIQESIKAQINTSSPPGMESVEDPFDLWIDELEREEPETYRKVVQEAKDLIDSEPELFISGALSKLPAETLHKTQLVEAMERIWRSRYMKTA